MKNYNDGDENVNDDINNNASDSDWSGSDGLVFNTIMMHQFCGKG